MNESDRYYIEGPLPETPEPAEQPEPWGETRVVGKPVPRVDAYERVTGSAVYPFDTMLPDMLHGAILRCPHAHAMVKQVDTSAAEKMPGMRAYPRPLGEGDTPSVTINPAVARWR